MSSYNKKTRDDLPSGSGKNGPSRPSVKKKKTAVPEAGSLKKRVEAASAIPDKKHSQRAAGDKMFDTSGQDTNS